MLMRKRVHAHGKGTWELVGGHLEFGESIEGCAVREAQEEIGVRIENVRVGPVTNDVFVEENKHYVTVFVIASTPDEPRNGEPQKCSELRWCRWDALPRPLFAPVEKLVRSGFDPFQ